MNTTTAEEALIAAETRLRDAREAGDQATLTAASVAYATGLVATNRWAGAHDAIDESLELARQAGDTNSESRLLGLRGMAYAGQHDLPQAELAFDAVLELAGDDGDPLIRSDALAYLGSVAADRQRLPEGLKKVEEAVGLARSVGDERRTMAHLGRLGRLFLTGADVSGATAAFGEAAQLADKLGDERAALGYLNNSGLVYLDEGRSEHIITTYRDVAQRAANLGERELEVSARYEVALASMQEGDLETVIAESEATLTLLEEDAARERQGSVELLLGALLRQERYDDAVARVRQELEPVRSAPTDIWTVQLLGLLGDACYGADDLDGAVEAYREAAEAAETLKATPALARIRGRLGAIYADQGRLEASAEELKIAVELSREADDQGALAEHLYLLALDYDQLGDPDPARRHAAEAASIFATLGAMQLADEARSLAKRLEDR